MAQPDPYNRVTSFSGWQADHPADPLQGGDLDAELNAVKLTTDQIRQNLGLIQRDDGALANESVGVDQLSSEITVGFNAPTLWATGQAYTAASTVFESGIFYKCKAAHTSGVFADDLAAGYWSLIADLTSIVATVTDLQATENTVSSAATTAIGVLSTFRVAISGTTQISAFDLVANRVRFVRFTGSLTIVHNATTMILPRGVNIVTQPGDWAIFSSNGSGYWTCEFFSRPIFTTGSEASPGLAFADDPDTGFYGNGDNTLSVALGGHNYFNFYDTFIASALPVYAPDFKLYASDGQGGSVWSTGDVKLTLKSVADPGWVMFNDGTIGDASSGASTRANADCSALYALIWNGVSDTFAPVTGGRGASASADWNAHKPIALTKMLGRAITLAGHGSGLSPRAVGQTFGADTFSISQANLPNVILDVNIPAGQGSHSHAVTYPNGTAATVTGGLVGPWSGGGTHNDFAVTVQPATLPAMTGTAALGGSGATIEAFQASVALNAMVKL